MSSSKEVSRGPCPNCDTSKGMILFDDGHSHCFACDHQIQPKKHIEKESMPVVRSTSKLLKNLQPFKKEWCGITVETLNFFGYCQAFYRDQQVHVATYNDQQGLPTAQHLRFRDKRFNWITDGDGISDLQNYCQNKWRQNHGRDSNVFCVLSEGEKDCMTISQVQGNKFPVVSIPSGTQSVKKAIAANLKWLSQFAWVVICFDNDEPGRKASQVALELLPAGKAAICRIPDPYKDANDMLVAGKGQELKDLLWKSQPARPDSIKEASTLWDELIKPGSRAICHYPWAKLNDYCHGFRKGEMITLCAGSGTGKSTVCKELAYHFLTQKLRVGYIALEESLQRTLQGVMGIALNKPLHLDETVEIPILKSAFDSLLGSGRLFLYDHFGSMDPDRLIEQVTYLATAEEVDVVILDHLTLVISGIELDERKALDVTCTKLRQCVEATGVGLILVSHLRRPQGKAHEEGQTVSPSDLRGSSGILQLSDLCISCSRNQQSTDAGERSQLQLALMKNRYSGKTGPVDTLLYDEKTGRLVQQTTFFQ